MKISQEIKEKLRTNEISLFIHIFEIIIIK